MGVEDCGQCAEQGELLGRVTIITLIFVLKFILLQTISCVTVRNRVPVVGDFGLFEERTSASFK